MSTLTTPLRSTCIVLVSLASLMALTACDVKESQAIRAMLADYDRANNTGNGLLAKDCVTQASDDQYDLIRRHALYSDEKTVRALGPNLKYNVIMTRNRAPADQLEVLTGEDFLVWTTNEGWFATGESGWVDAFGAIRVDGNTATAAMLDDEGRPTSDRVTFVKEGGRWRLDEPTMNPYLDKLIRLAARAEGMSEDDYILAAEEEDSGKEIPDAIWQPMIKQ